MHHHLPVVPISHPVLLATGTGKAQIKLSLAANFSPNPGDKNDATRQQVKQQLHKQGIVQAGLHSCPRTWHGHGQHSAAYLNRKGFSILQLPTQAISKQFVLLRTTTTEEPQFCWQCRCSFFNPSFAIKMNGYVICITIKYLTAGSISSTPTTSLAPYLS